MNESLILQAGDVRLVFGMRWFALLAERPRKAARRLGRQYRATHVLHAGATPSAVGLAWLNSAGSAHSAAQAVAMRYPSGSVALCMALRPGLIWLVAVHEGLVVARTDRLFDNPEAAARLLAELKLAYPGLAVAGETPAIELPDLVQLAQATGQPSQLSALRRLRAPFSRPVRAFLCALGIAAVLPGVYGVDVAESLGLEASVDNADGGGPDPLSTERVMAPVSAVPLVHGTAGLKTLLDAFHGVPLHPAGWMLLHADCDAGGAVAWQCVALYERKGALASNEGLLEHFEALCPHEADRDASPIGTAAHHCAWPALQIAFSALDQARVSWRPEARAVALTRIRPLGRASNDRRLLSALQGMQRAFTDIQIGESLGLQTAAAPADEAVSGSQAPVYRSRSLYFSGPLRSAALLLEHAGFMSWSRAELRYQTVDAPDIRRSGLHFTLQGLLYEIHASPVSGPSPDTASHGEAASLKAP